MKASWSFSTLLLSFVLSLLSSLELERLSDIFDAFYTGFVV